MSKKIILIAIDTLRADHFGCYGYNIPKTPTTPFMDSLTDKGALFLKHYATDVPTPPSYTALFYGTRGIKNGIIGFKNLPSEFRSNTPSLATCLVKRGFRTGMISNLLYPSPWLIAGFQSIYPPGLRFQGGSAEEVTDESIQWLKLHGKEDFFLFVHYWDPHCPYKMRAKEKYRKMFLPSEYKDSAPDMSYFEKNKYLKMFYDKKHIFMDDPIAPEENLAFYDANIKYVDDNIKRLFDSFKELGIKDEVYVIITSDHGEAFGEYGFWDHYSAYYNISKLPFIFIGPGIPKEKIETYTQNVDIMPTILELMGIEIPKGLCGISMVSLFKGKKKEFRKEVVVNSDATVIQRMYVKDDYALVHTLSRPVWDHIKEYELFNLSRDPDQVKDISQKEKEKTDQMRLDLGNWLLGELKGNFDQLQLSVLRGGWMWDGLSRLMNFQEVKNIIKDYPEVEKFIRYENINKQ